MGNEPFYALRKKPTPRPDGGTGRKWSSGCGKSTGGWPRSVRDGCSGLAGSSRRPPVVGRTSHVAAEGDQGSPLRDGARAGQQSPRGADRPVWRQRAREGHEESPGPAVRDQVAGMGGPIARGVVVGSANESARRHVICCRRGTSAMRMGVARGSAEWRRVHSRRRNRPRSATGGPEDRRANMQIPSQFGMAHGTDRHQRPPLITAVTAGLADSDARSTSR